MKQHRGTQRWIVSEQRRHACSKTRKGSLLLFFLHTRLFHLEPKRFLSSFLHNSPHPSLKKSATCLRRSHLRDRTSLRGIQFFLAASFSWRNELSGTRRNELWEIDIAKKELLLYQPCSVLAFSLSTSEIYEQDPWCTQITLKPHTRCLC